MVGSPEFLGKWNPNKDSGMQGLQMKWSEGHNWFCEIDYDKIQ